MAVGEVQASTRGTRVWRIANAEFDESRQELRVDGRLCDVEAKPLALLHELLLHAGEVVTKAGLMQAVWPGVRVVESSLPTAVSKLRQALGDHGRFVVEAVPRVGYRIGVPVELGVAAPRARLAFTLKPGDPVPNRPSWRLQRMLDDGLGNVWLATGDETIEPWVFKFADAAEQLDELKREVSLSAFLRDVLGVRPDLVEIVDWNFHDRPYFAATAFGGPNLLEWSGTQGPVALVPLFQRVAWVACVAETVAALHEVGVLHGNIKPANILVGRGTAGTGRERKEQLRLVGFNGGRGSRPDEASPITPHPVASLFDVAPEVQAGDAPTIAADIYALGLLLYRMATAELRRPLAPGWEADVEDDLLRQDIDEATAVDPSRRLSSAAILASRLRTLDARRMARMQQAQAAATAARLAEQAERVRLRRPWVVLAASFLVLGLAGTAIAALQAIDQRDQARRQTRIAQSVDDFLTEDLIGRGNPVNSGKPDETLMEAAAAAEPAVALRLTTEPLIAASLYRALALSFDSRSAYSTARTLYGKAIAAYDKAEGPGSADATIMRLRLAQMEAMAAGAGSLEAARALLAKAEPRLTGLGSRRAEAAIWDHAARAGIDIIENDVEGTRRESLAASDGADVIPDVIDANTRLLLHQRLAVADLRAGDWAQAGRRLEVLDRQERALHGPDSPDTILTEFMQARVLVGEGSFEAAADRMDRLYPKLLAVFGPTHHQTLLFLMSRAQALIWLGRYDRAVHDDLLVYQLGMASQGASYIALGALGDAGEASCRSGRTVEGLTEETRAFESARTTLGDGSSLTQLLSENIGLCLVLMKRYAEATTRLDQIDRAAAGRANAMADNDASIDLMRAEIAEAAGHTDEARLRLRRAEDVFKRSGEDPYMQRWAQRLSDTVAAQLLTRK